MYRTSSTMHGAMLPVFRRSPSALRSNSDPRYLLSCLSNHIIDSGASASFVERNKDVSDGPWDVADTKAVDEALNDARKRERQREKIGCGEVLLGQSIESLKHLVVSHNHPSYRGKQIHDAIVRHGVRSIEEIDTIPKALRTDLVQSGVRTGRSHLQHIVSSTDGTKKLLLQLFDGRVIETVGIPSGLGAGSTNGRISRPQRLTVCVSSQVGCPMRCTFCATGKGGFARNLLPHEIVDQVLTVQDVFGERCSNVVYMGMGEPLLNLPSVIESYKILNADVGIGSRNITISTVGVPNAIRMLAKHALQVTLAVSIHAPNQELRETIVPSAAAYPLEALLSDCEHYFQMTGRRVSFEYTLLSGVNDSEAHARALSALLSNKRKGNQKTTLRSHVNIIPWNPVDESEFKRPTKRTVLAFKHVLDSFGIPCSVRISRGLEAAAACGQLRNTFQKNPMEGFVIPG